MLSKFIEMINLLTFVSLPGYMIAISCSFVFWGIPVRPWLDRMIFFTIIQSLIVNWLFFHMPSSLYLASSLATFTLLFLFFFQPIRFADRTRLIIVSLLISFAVEITSGLLRIQHYSQEQIINNSVLLLTSLWPLYTIKGKLGLQAARIKELSSMLKFPLTVINSKTDNDSIHHSLFCHRL